MAELLLKGHRLNSSAAIREVIVDMRKTAEAPDMVLNMDEYGRVDSHGVCTTCAGGSAVIHGLGASRRTFDWTEDEYDIAYFYDKVRQGLWYLIEEDEYPHFGQSIKAAYSPSMSRSYDPDFFPAWERFADAVEDAEKEQSAPSIQEGGHS